MDAHSENTVEARMLTATVVCMDVNTVQAWMLTATRSWVWQCGNSASCLGSSGKRVISMRTQEGKEGPSTNLIRDAWTLAQRSPLCVQRLRLVGRAEVLHFAIALRACNFPALLPGQGFRVWV